MSGYRICRFSLRFFGSDRFPAGRGMLGLILLAGLNGCGMERGYSPPGNANPAGMILSQSGPEDFAPPVSADPTNAISDLSRQASSDVDWLLGNQRSANSSPPDTKISLNDSKNDQSARQIPRPQQRVIWNDTVPMQKAEPTQRIAQATPPDSANSPGKTSVSPLFRPEGDSVEVKNLPDPEAAPDDQTLQPDKRTQLMVKLTSELYKESTWSDMPLRNLLAIASLSMVDPERRLNPEALPDLSERERELFTILQAFFAELGEGLDGSKEAETVVTTAVTNLKQAMNTEPPLTLRTMALCSRVGSFGDYDEITRRSFLALAEESFGLYLEVDNFTSTESEKGQWVTELSLALTIYRDDDGTPVWRQNWTPTVDRSKNRRQDFFIAQKVMLPKALGTGKYQLKVRLRDDKNGAITEDAIEFTMVADPKMAREG